MLVAVVSLLLVATPALASERANAAAAVRQFVYGLNTGDLAYALLSCAGETAIIDEFPPFEWHGAGACAKWADDFEADARKKGITDGVVTLGKARHVDINGDYAYAVFPADYAFKQNGKATRQTGATFTVALRKGPSGWRITAWSWSAA
jgi:hypothetical protein